MRNLFHFTLVYGILTVVKTYKEFRDDLEPGPYCGINWTCCTDRNDTCSFEIKDTICYCDTFCNLNDHDDCCPDYIDICISSTKPNLPTLCPYGDKYYGVGHKIRRGCNECVCTAEGDWKCDNYLCIISDNVTTEVNSDGNLTWSAYNYPQFRDKMLIGGLVYRLGTYTVQKITPSQPGKVINNIRHFDARLKWPNSISPVVDQGWLASDWAISIATVVSDRLSIKTNRYENAALSSQALLSCTSKKHGYFTSGNIDDAWKFVMNQGLVDEKCARFGAKINDCSFLRKHNHCRQVVKPKTLKYAIKTYSEQDIMFEIKESGPVHAVMTVYQDFFHYRDGIYKHSIYGNQNLKGSHSIRIIGWGEENGEKYWIVANSWGVDWGEKGYFRIGRGEQESSIESFVTITFKA